jgi:uncharacterized protein
MHDAPAPGEIAWCDITVVDAESLRDFYAEVVGWAVQPVDMGGYQDFAMLSASGKAAAGICFARGGNADLPPVWLVYVAVEDLEAAVGRATSLGADVLARPGASMCVIRDPAGAAIALYEPPEQSS